MAFERRLKDASELAGLDDESLRAELEAEIAGLESELEKRSFTAMLSGPYDAEDALLAIHAGAGGTDSQDWASMLLRMYLRWAEQQGYKTDIWDMTEGEEAGIKSVTIAIDGKYAFGYLRSEKGVHRLVRLSPFDSAHRRHTSFALVEVLPQIAFDNPEVPDRSGGFESGCFPVVRCGRSECPEECHRHPDHAYSDRDRGHLPERTFPDAKPRVCHADFAGAFVGDQESGKG